MENERKATPRQLAYIHQLMKRKGNADIELDEGMDFKEASKMIEHLVEGPHGQDQRPVKINESRLGMAMKENFRLFRHYQKDIFGKHREWFKENVIKSYQLFTEIAQELDQSSQMEA